MTVALNNSSLCKSFSIMALMQHEFKELLDRYEFKEQMNPKTM